MTIKLLTIAVPTYNRANCLKRLLQVLAVELQGFEDTVELIISNNGSTDGSDQIIANHLANHPNGKLITYPQNLGPDENFAGCLRTATGRYFWIIGDDDLPRRGAVRSLLDVLVKEQPDLLYLSSAWSPEIAEASQQDVISRLDYRQLDALKFAKQTNVWLTFISGAVINLERLRAVIHLPILVQHKHTNMIQLGWVLPCLKIGQKFIYVRSVCVLATSNNTGGYKVMEVFAAKFPAVTHAILGVDSPLTAALIKGALATFLPGLAWNARFRRIGNFQAETVSPSIHAELSGYAGYWIFLAPIMRLPKWLAVTAYTAYRIARRVFYRDYLGDAQD